MNAKSLYQLAAFLLVFSFIVAWIQFQTTDGGTILPMAMRVTAVAFFLTGAVVQAIQGKPEDKS